MGVGDGIEERAARLTVEGRFDAARGRIRGQGWKVIGAGVAKDCASLGILGLGGLQILVRDVDLLLEVVQLRVLKYLPPVGAEILVFGLGGLPIADFFIGRRNFGGRAFVIWSNGATGKQKHGEEPEAASGVLADSGCYLRRGERAHFFAPAAGAAGGGAAICTFSPATIEPGGLSMPVSSPSGPALISLV